MEMASDHLRRALQDGRAVLAGGPGLGSQMILLRDDPESLAQQHLQGNAGLDEAPYPPQGFAVNFNDQNRKDSIEAGFSGCMPLDPNRGSGIIPPGTSTHAHSVVSPGLGFQNVDYSHQDVHNMQNVMQCYAYAQNNTEVASNVQNPLLTGGGEQGFSLQKCGNVPSTEMVANAKPYDQEAPPGGVSLPAGAVNHFQRNVMEDSRRLAMIHDFGKGPVGYPNEAAPHFQSGYHHAGTTAPALVDQTSVENPIYPRVQDPELDLQRMRDLQSQIIWKRQLEMELQRQQLQQQQLNFRQQYSQIHARMARGSRSPRLSQNTGKKKRPKIPPLAGPEGPGWCSICQADCNTAEILQQHIAGKRHQKKLQQAGKEGNDIAENSKQMTLVDTKSIDLQSKSELGLNDKSPDSYLGPRKHNRVDAEEPIVEPPAKKVHQSDEIAVPQKSQTNQKLPLFHEICKICDVACNSQLVLDAHLKGRRHAANARKLEGGGRSINKDIHHNPKRVKSKARIPEKTNFGTVEGSAKASSHPILDELPMTVGDLEKSIFDSVQSQPTKPLRDQSEIIEDQPTKSVADFDKGMSCNVEVQPTILQTTVEVPDNSTVNISEGKKGSDFQPVAEEQSCG